MNALNVGPLNVIFHRTVRVAEDKLSNLPPSLGKLPIYHDFIALHDKEAMWIDFRAGLPVAIIIGAGGINALTGEPVVAELKEGNYMVSPPQPWLDGWKGKDGSVYQFVATPYKKGEGQSVAEQLIGEKASNEIEIIVFESKDPNLIMVTKPQEMYGTSPYGTCKEILDPGSFAYKSCMGVGKGGKITQKVYPDPYGIDAWKKEYTTKTSIILISVIQYSEMTGEMLPPLPKSTEEYIGRWYGVDDQDLGDVTGSEKFDNLKNSI